MAPRPDDNLREMVAAALNVDVRSSTGLSGGDFASSHRVELTDGRYVFAKTHRNPPANFFTTEGTGLGWLRSTNTAAVPELLHVSDQPPLLILEWVEESRSVRPDEAQFGRSLAALHACGYDTFGRIDNRTTGSQAVPNLPVDSWAEFLSERRLRPLARIANDRKSLATSTIARIDVLAARIENVVPPVEPPSLLHGDLWAGNRIVDTEGRSWLIDPACFGGHREFDLSMMQLFGGFGTEVFSAYHEAFPLAQDWEKRVALHQLPPLIVHAIKFGGSYASAVERSLTRFL